MDIDILKTEDQDDPLGRGYSSMTPKEFVVDINSIYRTTNKTILTGTEILNAIPKTAFQALSATDMQMVWDIIHINGGINPFGIEADLFIEIFGAGSSTITALQALRVNNISRGIELGIGIVKAGHVQEARR